MNTRHRVELSQSEREQLTGMLRGGKQPAHKLKRAQILLAADAHRAWRKVTVTERRTAADFAACMRELSGVHLPQAKKIRVVLDNLSTHSLAALYSAMPAPEARRVLRRLEFHYTPKACQLAQYGRDRDRRLAKPVSRSPDPQLPKARVRNRRLGETPQQEPSKDQVDVLD